MAAPGRGEFVGLVEREGISCFRLSSLGKSAIPRLIGIIWRGRFDLVYGNTTDGASRNALIAAKIAGVPFIAHVRGMSRRASWGKLRSFRFANALVAVSAAAARGIASVVSTRSPHIVHNGVSLEDVESLDRGVARAYLRDKTGICRDKSIVIGVAHVCPRKGQLYAVEAMARLVSEGTAVHLLLIGALDRDPHYVEMLRARIRELRLERCVTLLGFSSDVSLLLKGGDIFLHTALSDPHPRCVLEAMAAELPVVAFAVDGVSETVRHGESGILVPRGHVDALAKALSALISDRTACAAFGRRGRQRVAVHFTAEETARKVGQIIDQTLADGSGRFRDGKYSATSSADT